MKPIVIEVPIRTISEANCTQHWTKKAERHRNQQFFVRLAYNLVPREIHFPCCVRLTRIASRFLDNDENLPMTFKWIKDEIGAQLFPHKVVHYKQKSGRCVQNKGHADSDHRVTWKYAQEKGKPQKIRIEIFQDIEQKEPNEHPH